MAPVPHLSTIRDACLCELMLIWMLYAAAAMIRQPVLDLGVHVVIEVETCHTE